jgi:hypothetical protein
MNVCENLSKYWECGTSENKQRIQKMLFPEGLYIVPEKRIYLTQNMNQVFQLIPLFTGVIEGRKTKKVAIIDDFSLLVAGDQTISNFPERYELVVELLLYINSRDNRNCFAFSFTSMLKLNITNSRY